MFLALASSSALADDTWHLDAHAGASDAVTAGDHLAAGVNVGVELGRERRWGRVGLMYGADLQMSHFGEGDDHLGTMTTFIALADYRLSYHADRVTPYVSLGAGLATFRASYAMSAMLPAGDVEWDQAFAVGVGAGVKWQASKTVAVGPYVRWTPTFEPALNQFLDIGISGTFGR